MVVRANFITALKTGPATSMPKYAPLRGSCRLTATTRPLLFAGAMPMKLDP